jgi:glycosyltransferase involved in cell wall biosynthesis
MITQPIVSVVMITYGHEKFIAQAINGVLIQECDFEIELIIADDCSPDKTNSVIHNILLSHPQSNRIRYFKQEKNIGMMPNFISAIEQAQGKYIAICEGDDFWTDSLKLQKQVNFLENNEDYGLVHTGYKILDNETKQILHYSEIKNQGFIFDELLMNNQIATLTVVLKKEFLTQALESEIKSNNFLCLDYSIWLFVSLKTKIMFDQNVDFYNTKYFGIFYKVDYF